MKKIRQYNDFTVRWSLVKKDTQEPFILEGMEVSLVLKNLFTSKELNDFTVQGNTIEWEFKGKDQTQLGVHTLTLTAVGEKMLTTDACDFVDIVDCDCKTGGDDPAGLETQAISLTSVVEFGAGGGTGGDLSAYLTKIEAEATYQPKGNYATAAELIELSAEVGKKVDADKVATINGHSLVNGGDITIEGGKGEKGDKGDKGDQGNSGYQGAADELEVVNNLTDGGETAALSAEMGKALGNEIYGVWSSTRRTLQSADFVVGGIDQNGDPTEILTRIRTGKMSVKMGEVWDIVIDSSQKWAYELYNVAGVGTYNSGWIAESRNVVIQSDGFIAFTVCKTSSSAIVPDELLISISIDSEGREGGLIVDLQMLNQKINGLYGDSVVELTKTTGKVLRGGDTVANDSAFELIDYVPIGSVTKIKIRTAMWKSDQSYYDTAIIFYDATKTPAKTILARELTDLDSKSAFVVDDYFDVESYSYVRFSNLITIPSSNTNGDFAVVQAMVSLGEPVPSSSIYDTKSKLNQSELNDKILTELYGAEGEKDALYTQDDLTSDNYTSLQGNTRGAYYFKVQDAKDYEVSLSVLAGTNIKAAIHLSTALDWANSTIYDSGWVTPGKSSFATKAKAPAATIAYIGFTYNDSATGVPTIDEIKAACVIEFKITKSTGLVGKVNALVGSSDGIKYQGEKIVLSDYAFTSEKIGKLSAGTSSRQGGALFGNYLFQFHNTLATIVVYNLAKKENVQVLNLTANSKNHAGSGGFGNEFYDSSDPFPLLYISAMDERKVYVYRITGTEGSWSISIVQTISLNTPVYIPNIAIDRENNMIVAFGYLLNSWSNEAGNASIIFSCPIPKLAEGDVTISEFSHGNTIPFIYAEQGAFARFGKLYMSYGNTATKAGAFVIDYVAGVAVSHLDFSALGTFEPEAFCKYGDKIVMTDQNGNIYGLIF